MVEGRNEFSHSQVEYIAETKSNEEFLKYVEEEIKGMKFYQNEAVKLFQQIKCLLNVKFGWLFVLNLLNTN